MHHNYHPPLGRKAGLHDQKIAAEKVSRQIINGALGELRWVGQAARQHTQLRYSDRGDFTRCYRGGF